MTLRVGLRRVEVLVVGFSKVLLRSLGFWLEMLETKPHITGNSKSSTQTEHTGAGCLHMFLKKLDISSSKPSARPQMAFLGIPPDLGCGGWGLMAWTLGMSKACSSPLC